MADQFPVYAIRAQDANVSEIAANLALVRGIAQDAMVKANAAGRIAAIASVDPVTNVTTFAGQVNVLGNVNVALPSGTTLDLSLNTLVAGVISSRWVIRRSNAAESGSDAGSDLSVGARADNGAAIDLPFIITRASAGLVTLGSTTTKRTVQLGYSGAALATTDITGFPTMPTCAGTPSGAPTGATAGVAPFVFDTTAHKFWVYDPIAAGWKGVAVT